MDLPSNLKVQQRKEYLKEFMSETFYSLSTSSDLGKTRLNTSSLNTVFLGIIWQFFFLFMLPQVPGEVVLKKEV